MPIHDNADTHRFKLEEGEGGGESLLKFSYPTLPYPTLLIFSFLQGGQRAMPYRVRQKWPAEEMTRGDSTMLKPDMNSGSHNGRALL